MAQHVGRGVASGARSLAYHLPDPLSSKLSRVAPEKQQWRTLSGKQEFARLSQVSGESILGRLSNRDNSFFVTFAPHQHVTKIQFQVFEFHADQLGDTERAGIKQLKHRVVACGDCDCGLGFPYGMSALQHS